MAGVKWHVRAEVDEVGVGGGGGREGRRGQALHASPAASTSPHLFSPLIWLSNRAPLHCPTAVPQVYQQLAGGMFGTLERMAAADSKHGVCGVWEGGVHTSSSHLTLERMAAADMVCGVWGEGEVTLPGHMSWSQVLVTLIEVCVGGCTFMLPC